MVVVAGTLEAQLEKTPPVTQKDDENEHNQIEDDDHLVREPGITISFRVDEQEMFPCALDRNVAVESEGHRFGDGHAYDQENEESGNDHEPKIPHALAAVEMFAEHGYAAEMDDAGKVPQPGRNLEGVNGEVAAEVFSECHQRRRDNQGNSRY